MGESVYTADVWIRPEDADHPKLERLRRVVAVSIGPDADVSVRGSCGAMVWRVAGCLAS